jgi:hypothetical protein
MSGRPISASAAAAVAAPVSSGRDELAATARVEVGEEVIEEEGYYDILQPFVTYTRSYL